MPSDFDPHGSPSLQSPNQQPHQLVHRQSTSSTPMASPQHQAAQSSPSKKSPKTLSIQIKFLDDSLNVFNIAQKALGKALFNQVCETLNLIEVDYFGLEYLDQNGTKYWLDKEKPIYRQLSLSLTNPLMYFGVKFYVPDPANLEDEFTRYLFALQIKRDLAQGLLVCNENIAALMAAYIIQAQLGDYCADEYPCVSYVSQFQLIPHQDEEFERKVMENHKKLIGMSPGDADYNLLETARRCELYGIKLTPVKDQEGVPLNLAVQHLGISVFQNMTKVNQFIWAKIRKLSFKRKKFLIKLKQEEFFGDVIEFYFEGRNECKNFWKKCIEQHSFFRCPDVQPVPRSKPRIFSRGSSFRYSGRTQQQIIEYVRQHCMDIKRPTFQRSSSARSYRGMDHGILSAEALPVSTPHLNTDVQAEVNRTGPSHVLERPKSAQELQSVEAKQQQQNDTEMGTTTVETHTQEQANATSQTDDDGEATNGPMHGIMRPLSESEHGMNGEDIHDGNMVRHSTLSMAFDRESMASQHQQYQDQGEISPQNGEQQIQIHEQAIENFECTDDRHTKRLFIKDLIELERTLKKDLDLINLWFKGDVMKEATRPNEVLTLLFDATESLQEAHDELLTTMEFHLQQNQHSQQQQEDEPHVEGQNGQVAEIQSDDDKISTYLSTMCSWLPLYERLLERLPFIMERLNASFRHNRDFERVCRDFESRKGCYLPYTTFIFRPALHVLQILNHAHRYLNNCITTEPHEIQTRCVQTLTDFVREYEPCFESLMNQVILMEIQRDITGMDNIIQPNRKFMRQGCLMKLSAKGFQQRMFFLFSDMLMYGSRSNSAHFQFKIKGHLQLDDLMLEELDPQLNSANNTLMHHCFAIYCGDRALIVAAGSEEEKLRWLRDLAEISMIKSQRSPEEASTDIASLSNELLDKIDSALSELRFQNEILNSNNQIPPKPPVYKSNTISHVCWHRNCNSVGREDYRLALVTCLSGYLLRKFKNSGGWQRLWVVFTNFSLFFFKSYQDDFPLASLPLIGYMLTIPSPEDNITKSFVFKLQFKAHVYFFRAENEYSYYRWVKCLYFHTERPPATLTPAVGENHEQERQPAIAEIGTY